MFLQQTHSERLDEPVWEMQMASTEVISEISGTVWKIGCRVGEEVAEHDVIMVLESMKMEIPVEAPRSGVIAELRVSAESSIDEGDVLCVIDS
jgi:acetyl-CoA carboxylase biotin carboxyl carrier protein